MRKAINLLFACFAATAMARSKPVRDVPTSVVTYVPTHPLVDNSTYANVE